MIRSPTGQPRTLAPVHPNAGLAKLYREKLFRLIDAMNASLLRWLPAAYKAATPMAQDSMVSDLLETMRTLGDRWLSRFNDAAADIAQWFAGAAADRSDHALRAALRKGGISVRFQMTPEIQDVLDATMAEQVRLIKSIASEHLDQVQGIVMRSVQAGRDVGGLAKELQARFGVTKKRANFIALSQNNIATATITKTRQIELGITECEWRHSLGGRHPRASHVKAGREKTRYDPRVGWYDPEVKRHVLPGELPRCRCVSRSIVEGFS